MTLSSGAKIDRLFKESQDRKMTTTTKAFYEEEGANLRVLLGQEVWFDDVNSTPTTAISQGIAYKEAGWLKEVAGYSQKLWLASGSSRGNWTGWIPPKCGTDYTISLYQSGSGTPGVLGSKFTNANYLSYGMVFDYQTGVLWMETTPSLTYPFYISGYRYSGSFAKKSSLDSLYAPSRAVANGLQTISNAYGEISHGLSSIPNYWSIKPSGSNVNFGITTKVDASKIYVYLTALGSRSVYWYAST